MDIILEGEFSLDSHAVHNIGENGGSVGKNFVVLRNVRRDVSIGGIIFEVVNVSSETARTIEFIDGSFIFIIASENRILGSGPGTIRFYEAKA